MLVVVKGDGEAMAVQSQQGQERCLKQGVVL